MKWIRDVRDLKLAYHLLKWSEELALENGKDINLNIAYLETKRAIRRYHKKQSEKEFPSTCVKDSDYGYLIELIELPYDFDNADEVKKWFRESHLYHTYVPSPYDCTGQYFTIRIKPVKRRGKWFVYHEVGMDV